jgi:hypothetical protein
MSSFPSIRKGSIRHLQFGAIGLILASLGWQLQPLAKLHNRHVPAVPTVETPELQPSASSTATLAQLFAQPANRVTATPISHTVRLVACFAGSDSRQSSALVAIDGQPTRRVRTGDQIIQGVQITAIQAQSIEVSRHGQTYRLRLGRNLPVPVSQQNAARNSFTPTSMHSIASTE